MTKKETTLPADLVGGKLVANDDQYIEFYENNSNMIHFDPPLTISQFMVLLEKNRHILVAHFWHRNEI